MDSLAREWLLGYSSTNSFKLRLCDHWRDDALTWSVTDSLCAWLAPFFLLSTFHASKCQQRGLAFPSHRGRFELFVSSLCSWGGFAIQKATFWRSLSQSSGLTH
jgi:hypothetical protein